MRLCILIMFLAGSSAAVAAESPPGGKPAPWAGYAFKPPMENYYPAASRNAKEYGTTEIRLCYDEQGRPDEVTVSGSSGFVRLDEAALNWGRAVRITPGFLRGKPRRGCARIPVSFSPEESGALQAQGDLLSPDVPPIRTDLPLPPPPPTRLVHAAGS